MPVSVVRNVTASLQTGGNTFKLLESPTKLKRTKSNIERIGWRLGNQDGIVKIA
jgi:hypothetical protein